MGIWILEILLGSEWEWCRFDSEAEAHATYAAVLSDYKDEVTRAQVVTPKGIVQQLTHRNKEAYPPLGTPAEAQSDNFVV
jgi:hypothetical protein